MSIPKKYKITGEQIPELVKGSGRCLATDKITVDGQLVKSRHFRKQ